MHYRISRIVFPCVALFLLPNCEGGNTQGGGGSGGATETGGTAGAGGAGGGAGGSAGGSSASSSSGSAGSCVIAADCPGADDPCKTRTCIGGACGYAFSPIGTSLPAQVVGDCKLEFCDGVGNAIVANNDLDVQDDNNACTADACANGQPVHMNLPAGTSCGGTLVCNANGACAGCVVASECPGMDNDCFLRLCNAGICGASITPANTVVSNQTSGDCLLKICDGNGNISSVRDNADTPPDDGNSCTDEVCVLGAPMHSPKPNNAACTDGDECTQTDTCMNGMCVGSNEVVCPGSMTCNDGICGLTCSSGTFGLPDSSVTREFTFTAWKFADMDGNGQLDIIGSSGTTMKTVFLHRGNGTFTESTGPFLFGYFDIADLNSDTKPDFVAADNTKVSIFVNNGDATFARMDYPPVFNVKKVITRDLNHDGKPDILFYKSGLMIHVWQNNGSNSYTQFDVAQPNVGMDQIEDLNGDGYLDYVWGASTLFVPPNNQIGYIKVGLSTGNGTYAPAVTYGILDSEYVGVELGDVDDDGDLDMLVATIPAQGPTNVQLRLNDGSGTFGSPSTQFTTGYYPKINVFDVDDDGKNEIVAGWLGTVIVQKYGQPPKSYPSIGGLVGATDVNADGKRDLVVADKGIQELLNDGNGGYIVPTDFALPRPATSFGTADVNGDGRLDFFYPPQDATSGSYFTLLLNNGNGGFSQEILGSSPATNGTFALNDINGDSKLDYVVAEANTDSVRVFTSNGPSYGSSSYFVGANVHSVAAADVNGDGKMDFAATSTDTYSMRVFINNGNGTFTGSMNYLTNPKPKWIVATDLNVDGAPDFVVHTNDAGAAVHLNNGNGTFAPQITLPGAIPWGMGTMQHGVVGTPTSAPLIATDINGDQLPDIVTADGTNKVKILTNNGSGTFNQTNGPLYESGYDLTVADFDGNGKIDIAARTSSNLNILLGNGDGTFALPLRYSPTAGARLVSGDFNGDGRVDIAASNWNALRIYYNRCAQ